MGDRDEKPEVTLGDNADRMPDEALADATSALLAHIARLPEGSSVSREELMGSDAYQRANLALTAVDDHDFAIADIRAELKAHGYIASIWHIDDVKEVHPGFTDAQAMETLESVQRNHDAEIGINWEVLRLHADFIQRKQGEPEPAPEPELHPDNSPDME